MTDPSPLPPLPFGCSRPRRRPRCQHWPRPTRPASMARTPATQARHPSGPDGGRLRESRRQTGAGALLQPAALPERLRAGAIRIDLQGQPAGVVTAAEARNRRPPTSPPGPPGNKRHPVPRRIPLPANDTPLPQEASCPDVPNSPSSFRVAATAARQGGLKIGIQTGRIVTAILPPKIWRRWNRRRRTIPNGSRP